MDASLAILRDCKGTNDAIIDHVPYSFGRCRNANFIIVNVTVSRNHCEISYEGNVWTIHDFSSSGTFVNDVLVGKGKSKILRHQDLIRFGPLESNLLWRFYIPNKNNESITQEPEINMFLETRVLEKKISENNSIRLKLINENKKITENCEELLDSLNSFQECNILENKDKIFDEIQKSVAKNKETIVDNDIIEITSHRRGTMDFSNKKPKLFSKKMSSPSFSTEKLCANHSILERQELVTKLRTQEDEKRLLMRVISEMKRAQKILSERLEQANHTHLLEKASLEKKLIKKEKVKAQIQEQFDTLTKTKEEIEETLKIELAKNGGKKIEELLEELEDVKKALNDLQDKNIDLEMKLADATTSKSEALKSKSTFLENVTYALESEFQCTICSELFVSAITLNCTHTFCKYCISQWKKKQKNCPMCRAKITSETRSLVLDNYIDKMVENLSDELKQRRKAVVEERTEVHSGKCRHKRSRN